MNTVGAEDMACTDEIKVYEDEGEEDEQAKSSENLTEDKVGLVIESEGQVPRLFDLFGRNGSSFFKMPWPTDSRLASYFLPGYPAAIAAVMAAANNMRSPSVSSPASSSGGGDGGGSLFGMSSGPRQESSAFARTADANGSGFLSGLSGVADAYGYGPAGTTSTSIWGSRKETAAASETAKFLPASFACTSSSFCPTTVSSSSSCSTTSSCRTTGGYQQTGDTDRISGIYKQPAAMGRPSEESQSFVGNRLPSFIPNPFNFMPFYNPLRGSASDSVASRPPQEPGKSPVGSLDLASRGAFSGPPRYNCVDASAPSAAAAVYTATVPASESGLCYKNLSAKDHTKTISSPAANEEIDGFGSPAQRRAEVSCASSSLYAAAACAAAVVAAVASWGSSNATTVSSSPTMATSSTSSAAAAASSDLLSPSYPPPLPHAFSQSSPLHASPTNVADAGGGGGAQLKKSPLFVGPLSPRNWFGPSVGAGDFVGSGPGNPEAVGRQSVKTLDQGAGSPYSPSMFAAAAAAAHMHFLSAAAAAASFTGGLSNTSTSTTSALGGSQPLNHNNHQHQGSAAAAAAVPEPHMTPRKLLGSGESPLWQTPSRLGNAFPSGGARPNGDPKGFPFSSSSSSALSSIGEFVRSPGQGKLQDKSGPRKSVWDLHLDATSPGDAASEPDSFRGRIGGLPRKKTHIKKPLNAFMLFMKEMRPRVQEECTLKESAAINQILGKKWHELSRAEQTKYYEMARQAKELHQRLYPGWSARDNYAYHARRRRRRRPFHRYHSHHTEGTAGLRVTNTAIQLSSAVRLNGRPEGRSVGAPENDCLQRTTSTRPSASPSVRPPSQEPLSHAGRRPARPVSASGVLSTSPTASTMATKKRPASSISIQPPRLPQQPPTFSAACAKPAPVSLSALATVTAAITTSSAADSHRATKSPALPAQTPTFQSVSSSDSAFAVSASLPSRRSLSQAVYAGTASTAGGLQQQQQHSPRKQAFPDQAPQASAFPVEERLKEERSRTGGNLTLSACSAFQQHQQQQQHSRQEQPQLQQNQPQQQGLCSERLPYGVPLRNHMMATPGAVASHPWPPSGYPGQGSLFSQTHKGPYGGLLNSSLVNNDSVAAVAAVAAMAAGELSGGSMKKCRARFGLEHQNLWCKPCRRKKKCIRFISDSEMDDFMPSAFSVGHNPAMGLSAYSVADRFGVLSRRGLAGLMGQSTCSFNGTSLSRVGQPLKPSAPPPPAPPPFGQFPAASFGRQYPQASPPLSYTQTGISNPSAYPTRPWLDPRRAFDLSAPGGQTNGQGCWSMTASRQTGTVPWCPAVGETASTDAFSNQHDSHRISSMMAAAAAFSAAATSSASSVLGRSNDGGLLRKRASETLGQKIPTQRMLGRPMDKQGHVRGLDSASFAPPSSTTTAAATTIKDATAVPASRLNLPEFSPPARVQVLKSDQTTAQGITKHRQPAPHSEDAVLPSSAKKMRDSIGFGVADVMGFGVHKRQQSQPSVGQPAGRTNGLPGFHSDGRNGNVSANNSIASVCNTAPKLWETVSPSTSSCPLRSSPEME